MTPSIFDKKQQAEDKKLQEAKEKKSKEFTTELNTLLDKYGLRMGAIMKYTEMGAFPQIIIDDKKVVKE